MSLPYELEVLDELISETIHPQNLVYENAVSTTKQFAGYEKVGFDQKTKFKKRLKPVAYSFLKEKHKKLYIHHHLSAVIQLLDKLFYYINPKELSELNEKETDSRLTILYKRLFAFCSEMLAHIKESFPQYINTSQKIPDHECLQAQTQWKNHLPAIKRKLSRINADKNLSKIIFAWLDPLCDKNSNFSLTYHTIAYINDLLSNLEKLKPAANEEDFCSPLSTLVIYLNLNETDFKDYLADCICSDSNKAPSVKEKLDKLFFYYKQVSQVHTKPGAALIQRARSVKDEIRDWLAGEIKYLQKTQNLGIIMPARFKKNTEYKKGIWYTYTVEEISLLYRLQYDAKYITNKKVRPMIKDLSELVHTETMHNVSAKSLYNSFYKIKLNTIQSLNDKLFMLINHLRKIESQVKHKAKEKQSFRKSN